MKRLPFLDWTRGLAVLIMIECHTFNCFARLDERQSGAYILSQFVGGMAAVLFLFLAGVTFSYQMDRLDRRESPAVARLDSLLSRAAYILVLAYLFRINNSIFSLPSPPWRVLLKVDILNCMGLSMGVLALLTLCPAALRPRIAALAGVAIAATAPLWSGLDWTKVPTLVGDYVAPSRKAFGFFPWSAYLAFGMASGSFLRPQEGDRMERVMQWSLLAGLGLIACGRYFADLPWSPYTKSDLWVNSPALVAIRLGVILAVLAGAFLWTEYAAGTGWSWIQNMGKTSLLVYWVHVILVYGVLARYWKAALNIPQTLAATVGVTGLMVLLSEGKLRWKEWGPALAAFRQQLWDLPFFEARLRPAPATSPSESMAEIAESERGGYR